MTHAQVEWARQHDWYTCYIRNGSGLYTVLAYDSEVQYSVRFTEFKALRAWAGY